MKYRDTSKIVTFYTKEYGKLKGIAKGARSAKNKFGSALEPMNRSMLVLYKKEHRDLHLISQCDTVEFYKNLVEDLNRMSTALGILELVNQVTHDEERKPELYDLLVETLQALDSSKKNFLTYLQAFKLKLAAIFGYAPNFNQCNECGEPIVIGNGEKRFAFQIARGAIYCNRCSMHKVSSKIGMGYPSTITSLSAPGLQIVRRFLNAQTLSLSNIEYDERIGNEIDELLRLYLRYHFEGLKPLKSIEILNNQ